jgi:hypothetical protein
MVEHENKLSKFPETQVYVDFGLEQVEAINARHDSWIAEQTFADDAVPSQFERMVVDGHSEFDLMGKKSQDRLKWNLYFPNEVKKNQALSNALLHVKRLPDVTTFNSKPQLFDTSDYIHIDVYNGERSWVKTGDFPVNVHVEENYDAILSGINNPPKIALQTDIKREALAGFEAAHQWQKFRAMAVTCTDFLIEQLGAEWDAREIEDDHMKRYDASQHHRSRRENVFPLYVELLPDVRIEEGPTALKQFYRPGVLEAAVALELEHSINHSHGSHETGGVRPISYMHAFPIEITSDNDGKSYDARIKFDIHSKGYLREDENNKVRTEIEKQLGKHYDVKLKDPGRLEVVLEVKDAYIVEQALKDGATDTVIHTWAQGFGDALRYTNDLLREWRDEMAPALKEEYLATVNRGKDTHFASLGDKLY